MIRITYNKDLGSLNTFGMKVKAACYVVYSEAGDLPQMDWDKLPQPILPLGSGSNILFTKDFPGTILHSDIKDIDIIEQRSRGDEVYVRAGSGVVFDDLCAWAASKQLWGIENLSAIPGTVGASAVQNVGAYGVEAGDVIDSVICYERSSGQFVTLNAEECAFAYRDSIFKHQRGRYIVVSVVFRLTALLSPQLEYGHLREAVERNIELMAPSTDPYPVLEPHAVAMPLSVKLVRDTVRIIREEKLPDPAKIGSAGSFFKNPVLKRESFVELCRIAAEAGRDKVPHFELEDGNVKLPAAFLIEMCGFKGKKHGGAGVWEKQPLVIVNASGDASPDDILQLENEIITAVNNKFGILLNPEVDHI